MLGAIIGDIAGSVYEWNNIKTKEFPFLGPGCRFTDDTVMTLAVASACLLRQKSAALQGFQSTLVSEMQRLGRQYPDRGYGAGFYGWLMSDHPQPYGSFGNGSAMRVSPVAYAAATRTEAEALAKASAEVTHNHPDGIRGAQAVAAAVFLARHGSTKEEIRSYTETQYYALSDTLEEIRPAYTFDVTCQGSVPQAITAFLESNGFEDAIRNAISLGGDSDTIACIAGGIAEAYYGIPEAIRTKAVSFLRHEPVFPILTAFETEFSL